MHRAVEAMVRQRKIDLFEETNLYSKKDFMSRMLLATDDNGHFFSETDIASHLVSLVQGSYSTLQLTITMIMKYLAELPRVYDLVRRGKLN